MTTVLITDARYKHALAALRNLAAHNVRVVAGAPDNSARRTGALASRHLYASFVYPEPTLNEAGFVRALSSAIEQYEVDVLLPIGDASVGAVARNRDSFPNRVRVPLGPWEGSVAVAADKQRSIELAALLGVPVPRTFVGPSAADSFPVVVKPRTGSGNVRYAATRKTTIDFDPTHDLCQEYVDGVGCAYFGLFEHGTERAHFMHRRIREFPPSGGPSTAAESIADEDLRDLGSRLLEALNWHGVAMVEFKRDRRDGRYKLMEINPKFWGSLELSIAAGVEFPWLAVQLALEEPLPPVPPYAVGLRFQWVFDDLLHVVARPRSAGAFLRDLGSRSTRHDVQRKDIRPFFATARDTATRVVQASGRAIRLQRSRP